MAITGGEDLLLKSEMPNIQLMFPVNLQLLLAWSALYHTY